MANPQKEDGYTAVANEILEKLVTLKLGVYEWRILLYLMRKTYGYQKKEDWISKGQFAEATGIKRVHVIRTINSLLEKRIITKTGDSQQPKYGIQKDWEKWNVPSPSRGTSTAGGTSKGSPSGGTGIVPKGAKKVVPQEVPTKESLQKKVLQKKKAGTARRSKKELTPEQEQMNQDITDLFERFEKTINPTINYGHKTNRKAAQWMIKKWGIERTLKLADYAISLHGTPYAPTVSTPYQLKEKYAQVSAHYLKNQKEKDKNTIAIID